MSLRVRTILPANGPATAIELTDAQVAELGAGKRAAVLVTIGERTARLRLGVMGGHNLIGLSTAARDLAAALAAAGARAAFDALPPSRRKELARAVAEAKRAETRERRIAATVADLGG